MAHMTAKRMGSVSSGTMREERATMRLMDCLIDSFENERCEWLDESNKESSVWADLTGAVLEEVDWHEIAKYLLENVDKSQTELTEDA